MKEVRVTNPDASSSGGQRKDLMTPAEVGRLFGVTAKTASRWADQGHLDSVRTLGGNRRFLAEQVHQLYSEYLRVQDRGSALVDPRPSGTDDEAAQIGQLGPAGTTPL